MKNYQSRLNIKIFFTLILKNVFAFTIDVIDVWYRHEAYFGCDMHFDSLPASSYNCIVG